MDSQTSEQRDAQPGIIAFQAPRELIDYVKATAAAEGISKSDVVRALIRKGKGAAA